MAGWGEAPGSSLSAATSGKIPDVRVRVPLMASQRRDQHMVAIRYLAPRVERRVWLPPHRPLHDPD